MPFKEKSTNSEIEASTASVSVLSWGCGVQSTALAVMSVLGDMPALDLIVTSDTGWERKKTYESRDFYTGWLRQRGATVMVVDGGNVRVDGAKEHVHIPFFTQGGGPLRRQCTRQFKIVPIKHAIREWLGFHVSRPPAPPAGSVKQWLGISYDEYERMRGSGVAYILNCYPLVQARITRDECKAYLNKLGLPVPVKSACVGCPYRSASEWLDMKSDSHEEFMEAVQFDELNRNNPHAMRVDTDALYLHRSLVPLAAVDLEGYARREVKGKQLPMFCESGYCHV